jgi:hypothetical protein
MLTDPDFGPQESGDLRGAATARSMKPSLLKLPVTTVRPKLSLYISLTARRSITLRPSRWESNVDPS